MAFIDTNMAIGDLGPQFGYNVTNSVGGSSSDTNATDDVALVQYFLNRIYAAIPFALAWPNSSTSPSVANFNIDGLFGPITQGYIEAFQNSVKVGIQGFCGPSPIVNDSRVDRAAPGLLTPIHQAIYTIVYLNNCFQAVCTNIQFSNIPGTDPAGVPSFLINLFTQGMSQTSSASP